MTKRDLDDLNNFVNSLTNLKPGKSVKGNLGNQPFMAISRPQNGWDKKSISSTVDQIFDFFESEEN